MATLPLSDEADFSIELTLSDIRCGPGTSACGPANDRAGADYTGQLQIEHVVRLTDKSGAYEPTTVQDYTVPSPGRLQRDFEHRDRIYLLRKHFRERSRAGVAARGQALGLAGWTRSACSTAARTARPPPSRTACS